MEFQKVIETRRTVRKYSADERVTRAVSYTHLTLPTIA